MNHPYLPLTDSNRSEMFRQMGVNSLEDLLSNLRPILNLKVR